MNKYVKNLLEYFPSIISKNTKLFRLSINSKNARGKADPAIEYLARIQYQSNNALWGSIKI